jgi:nicotinamidase-related amidase
MTRNPNLLTREDCVLLVIDIQEPFIRNIHEPDRLLSNIALLTNAAAILGIPIIPTVQNGERMGGVLDQIAACFPPECPAAYNKLSFSCFDSANIAEAVQLLNRNQVLLCGVETHICVAQTAIDLSANGYQVHVAADAVSSRSMEKHKLGMERMRDNNILPCAAEAAVYEWLREAGTPEFKQILKLVK